MSEQYVSGVTFEHNGAIITDFKKFSEGTRVLKKGIKLMRKRGHVKTTPEYNFTLDYVIPANKPEHDFEDEGESRVTVEYESGQRYTYTGVEVLEIGETTFDDENEATRTISFAAADRIKE